MFLLSYFVYPSSLLRTPTLSEPPPSTTTIDDTSHLHLNDNDAQAQQPSATIRLTYDNDTSEQQYPNDTTNPLYPDHCLLAPGPQRGSTNFDPLCDIYNFAHPGTVNATAHALNPNVP